ncbi:MULTISPECIES: AAA family ATPase [Pasteurella]|uniref:AAA family ATPase n=1 Tax=Pasteurella TaxID=745 RepID=UPI0007762043|nr:MULTISPECIES: CpaE family protein [Pasteurella]AMM81751.1 pilus assembly protein [Pasteurella multocida subsp. multocida PMTB2.1]APW58333.1 pilus assembly protein [Pasteurella multocida]AXQ71993.1 pilus assembly protein [Pasteurella multocida subsp. multocida]MCH4803153.1 CpaE family protein [Pasteurella multocida]MCL7849743.1 CpaE family protein [Pasteurella multocida]
MLLLDKENITVDSARKIIVVSSRGHIQNDIAQILRTRGLENLEIVDADFFLSSDLAFLAEETLGVIVDIGHETDIKIIAENIYSIVPQSVWCCVIGESDSISLAQKLLEEGVLYFHSDTQLSQMAEKIVSGVNIPLVRHTVRISVLSCKGGSGASLISSHLANEIVTNKKVPVLLAQGPNGSQDLDLAFDKKLQGDIVEYSNNLDLFNGIPSRLSVSTTDKYNFIIYDQPIFNVVKDDFVKFLEYSNSFVLVVERSIVALRVAKQFLDECERMRSTTGKPIRTFICISDSRLETSKLMAISDIETLLKCQVDVVIPFLKKTDAKTVLDIDLGRVGKKEINTLMMKVVGAVSRHKQKKERQSLFSSLRKAIMGN